MKNKIDVEHKARELNVLVKRIKQIKTLLEKNGCEVTLYLNENIVFVKKRIL